MTTGVLMGLVALIIYVTYRILTDDHTPKGPPHTMLGV